MDSPLYRRAAAQIPQTARRMIAAFVAEVPFYAALPRELLDGEVTAIAMSNLRIFHRSLREDRVPTPQQLAEQADSAARRAQERFPLDALLAVCHIGARVGLEMLEELAEPAETADLVAAAPRVVRYLQAMIPVVADAYLQEQQAIHGADREARRALVEALLAGDPDEALAERVDLDLAPRYLVLVLRLTGTDTTGDGRGVWARRTVRLMQRELDHHQLSSPGHVLSALDGAGGTVLLSAPPHPPTTPTPTGAPSATSAGTPSDKSADASSARSRASVTSAGAPSATSPGAGSAESPGMPPTGSADESSAGSADAASLGSARAGSAESPGEPSAASAGAASVGAAGAVPAGSVGAGSGGSADVASAASAGAASARPADVASDALVMPTSAESTGAAPAESAGAGVVASAKPFSATGSVASAAAMPDADPARIRLDVERAALPELVERIAAATGSTVIAGVAVADTAALPAAVTEAEEVAELAERLGRPSGVYGLDDMLLEHQLSRPGPARDRLAGMLAPLACHPHLLEAVRAYVECGYNRHRAAARIHVHRNTLNYRLRRVEALTGVDPADPVGCRMLAAALITHDVVEKDSQNER
ncbi:helix-turn-helix domain-containing protein [Actinomadura fulvescens]